MKTWYTQPDKSFASFYYYNETTLELVRIRLELGRAESETDPGDTVAIYSDNRYVGFSKFPYVKKESDKFRLKKGKEWAVYDGRGHGLGHEPRTNYYVYDFKSRGTEVMAGTMHHGNAVVDRRDAKLPPGITGAHLERLAKICLSNKGNIVLTKRDAKDEELVAAIKEAIAMGLHDIGDDDIDDSGDHSPDETAPAPHPPGCRCCRCTIL